MPEISRGLLILLGLIALISHLPISATQDQPKNEDSTEQKIPELPAKLAEELCKRVKVSRLQNDHKFLWTALSISTQSTTDDKTDLLPEKHYLPGCYKYKFQHCGKLICIINLPP
jgi:hypothetical protein